MSHAQHTLKLLDRLQALFDQRGREVILLREVHEAARQFLRFRGIDKERQDAALVHLVDATGAVKDYDATS
jgi:hypothetical protein